MYICGAMVAGGNRLSPTERQVRTGPPQAMEGFIHRPAANEKTCIYGKIMLMHMSG